ncbi:DMT family transporter [Mycobacterium dioxanotrophicus]|nr:DMT family transporter [Mycobacterium dioxanotrophicus]
MATAPEGPAADETQPDRALFGYAAMGLTVAVWAAFALSIRFIEVSEMAAGEVALIRFAVPMVVLLPWLPSRWRTICRIRWSIAAMIFVGAGLPYFLTASWGGSLSTAIFVGALIPGLVPVFALALALTRAGRKATTYEISGAVVITCGVGGLLSNPLSNANMTLLFGASILVAASMMWSMYTTALSATDLDAVGCTLLLSIPSAVVTFILLAIGVLPGNLQGVFTHDAIVFVLVQGLGVGVIANLSYRYAIRTIGAQRSSVLGSLSPVATVLLAVPLLGEKPTEAVVFGVVLIVVGVALSYVRSKSKREINA